jgi:hypothetical protein
MSAGLRTRTKAIGRIPWQESPIRLAAKGSGRMTAAHWRALQPGHYGREGRAMSRGETLKSACRLSLSQVLNSRLPVCHRQRP